jgi:hypothetical protein
MEFEVHPAAAVFPMMSKPELDDLAADIKANGLLHPIILDADGTLIDGRNRLEACRRAKVEPRFEQLNGHDPLAFIVSANLTRRQMTNAQRAMALAMIYPESPRGRGNVDPARKETESGSFSYSLLKEARVILRFSEELAQDVLHRGKTFDAALAEARKAGQERRSHDYQLNELRRLVPDVAAMVEDGRLTLEQGRDQLGQRQQEVRSRVKAGAAALEQIVGVTAQVQVAESLVRITPTELAMIDVSASEFQPLDPIPLRELDDAIEALGRLRQWKLEREEAEA